MNGARASFFSPFSSGESSLSLVLNQFSSVTQLCPTLCDPMNRSSPGLPVHHQLLESTQTHVHRVDDAIQSSHPLLSPSAPAPILPSIWVFSNESSLHMRWPKYWSFSFQWTPRTSFKMDWLDLLVVQGTPKSLLQHHSSKTSILRCSTFFLMLLDKCWDQFVKSHRKP